MIPEFAMTTVGCHRGPQEKGQKKWGLPLLFVFFCAGALRLPGQQVDCTNSTKLICQFPVSATVLAESTVGGGSQPDPHALVAADKLAYPLNEAFAAQVTQLPIPTASVGVVSLRPPGSDVGVPFDNLGPILTDRPDTVGKGHVFLSGNFQHFNFNAIDGVSLATFPLSYEFISSTTPNQQNFASVANNINFTLDQWVGLLTFGAGKSTDVSIIVPINSVSVNVTASNPKVYSYYPGPPLTYHVVVGSDSLSTSGSASGIGDIAVSVKQLIAGQEGEHLAVAAGGSLRAPTGDASNYLGSGALGGQIYGILEYRYRKIAPHLKAGYQWNGVSRALTYYGQHNVRLPDGLQYDIGSAFRLARMLTVDVDVLGNQYVNGSTVAPALLDLPTPTAGVPGSIPSLNASPHTYTTANFSFGAKWEPIPHYLIYFNLLKNVNNVGLTSNVVPLIGIAYHR